MILLAGNGGVWVSAPPFTLPVSVFLACVGVFASLLRPNRNIGWRWVSERTSD